MATKRDQLQSHRFLVQRVVSALVTRELDPETPPFRRPSGAAFGGIAVAVVALLAVGVYGLIVPGGNRTWRNGPAVLVVKETGARYVFLDGRLHPVLNYVSALLALGRNAPVRSVSRNSLAGVPRGPRIGIPDAPDAVPASGSVLRGGWSLCSAPTADRTGSTVDETVLLVGSEPAGGAPLDDAALLVAVAQTGDQYLIWRGHRHRIRQPDTVTVGLALRTEPRARVGTALVDVLPAGEPLAPIAVPGMGTPSTAVPRRPDLRAGQLVTAQTTGGEQRFLVQTDRLRPVTELQFDIQLAWRETAAAYGGAEPQAVPIGIGSVADARQEPAPATGVDAAPPRRPGFVGADRGPTAVCVTYDGGAEVPRLRTGATVPDARATATTAGRTAEGLPLADRVFVPPGKAALVEVLPSPRSPSGTLVLVSDQSRAHPLAPDVLPILRYERVKPVRLPAGLVSRVPLGSGLDPVAARRT